MSNFLKFKSSRFEGQDILLDPAKKPSSISSNEGGGSTIVVDGQAHTVSATIAEILDAYGVKVEKPKPEK